MVNRGTTPAAVDKSALFSLSSPEKEETWTHRDRRDYNSSAQHRSLRKRSRSAETAGHVHRNTHLALIGDSAEGVPGVTGVGASKAAHLLRSYHSLNGILAGAGILMDRVGATLRREKPALLLSRELVALKTTAVLGVTWRQLTVVAR